MTDQTLGLSDTALKRVAELRKQQGDDTLMLRVTVNGGGCNGFQYHFDFDTKTGDDDIVFEKDGVRYVTDKTSLDLLNGSEIDFKDELMGAYFSVNNPNADTSCGCGTSFSLKM